jgi:hypothetical protein
MKYTTSILLAFLFTTSAHAIGFGFDLGPFNLQLDAPVGGYIEDRDSIVDDPICYAISHQQRLSITVEGMENISTKERKIVTKQVIVEPYAFGVRESGAPVLRGNVVEDKMIKEITVKTGEDTFYSPQVLENDQDKGFFSATFQSDTKANIDVRKVTKIEVIEESHFDVPKDFKGLQEEGVEVICQLPIAKDQSK